ncbi:MAG: IPT/TIG domain-containing protein, partial [Terriglobia bacterium]
MSKKKSRKQSKQLAQPRSRRKPAAVIALMLILAASGVIIAQRTSLWAIKGTKSVEPPEPPQSQQPALAKEYVYAGGRLIATEEPLAPSITTIDPSTAFPGNTIPLTITGSNLAGATSINFTPSTGIAVSNISSTSNQVTATVSISITAQTIQRNVSVTTPSGASGALPFYVGNPVPEISSITPNSIMENTAFPLTVNGTGFINGSVIRINGVNLATTFNTDKILTANVTGQTAGLKKITVFNPAPGGGLSNEVTLTVNTGTNNPVPHIGSISPSNVTAGNPAFTLTVNSDNSSFRT